MFDQRRFVLKREANVDKSLLILVVHMYQQQQQHPQQQQQLQQKLQQVQQHPQQHPQLPPQLLKIIHQWYDRC